MRGAVLLLAMALSACAAPRPRVVTVHDVVTRTVYVHVPARVVYVPVRAPQPPRKLAAKARAVRSREYALAANPSTSNAQLTTLRALDEQAKQALAPLKRPGHTATPEELARAAATLDTLQHYLATTHPGGAK